MSDTLNGGDGDDIIRSRDGPGSGLLYGDAANCEAGYDQAVIDWNDSTFGCEVIDSTPAPPLPLLTPPTVLPPQLDRLAPVISGLAVSPRSFFAAPRGGSIAAATGAAVSYRLSEAGVTTFRMERAASGRRVGTKCVAPTRRNRRARPCTRYLQVRGSFIHTARRGSNSFRFTGRLAGKKLQPGKYRLSARSKDPAGNLSASVQSPFGIRRPRP